MPEIENECIFEVVPSSIILRTQVNGDAITIKGIHFTKESAASLAWLINNSEITSLEIQIKEKT